MAGTNVDLHFCDLTDRAHVVRARTLDGHDWHLSADINGFRFTKHCNNWDSVERTVSWLRRHAHEPQAFDTRPPMRRALTAPALGVMLVAFSIAVASAQQAPMWASPPVTAFMHATRDYALMHRRLERQIGSIELNTPIETINRLIQQLAAAIRAERPNAVRGEFFTPDLADELRFRVGEALRANDLTAADVRDAARVDGIDYGRVRLNVNATFPWVLGAAMFPCLIDALPPLPSELQYRIVGNDLVLIDVHASLIVDVLPNVLAEMTVNDNRRDGGVQ